MKGINELFVFSLGGLAFALVFLLITGCASGAGGYAEDHSVWRGPAGSIDYHRWAMSGH